MMMTSNCLILVQCALVFDNVIFESRIFVFDDILTSNLERNPGRRSTLKTPYTCRCPDNYDVLPDGTCSNPCPNGQRMLGDGTCAGESSLTYRGKYKSGRTAATVIGVLVSISLVIFLVGWIWWRRRNAAPAFMNFDNPVYRRTTVEVAGGEFVDSVDGDELKLSIESEQYHNALDSSGTMQFHTGGTSNSMTQPLTEDI